MQRPNLKSVALPVPEITGTLKSWAVPAMGTHASFSPKFLWPFVRMDLVNILAKFEVFISRITRS